GNHVERGHESSCPAFRGPRILAPRPREARRPCDSAPRPMPPPPFLSVVVPAFNEAARISLTMRLMLDYLAAHHPSSEVIVVDDGSQDDTARIVEGIAKREARLRLVRLDRNRGKGAAVR